ncbi:hypothetical protein HPB51_021491 [Rhipicephalus microplus]|uniref:DUF7041 domain-containing protein n=1 Tax=Rhipicephalus microplus TaxID=6941 RepID=A0A9J6EPY1_RHIMP|nr:hypothetical protein HPB51_021491 [Rhipicephalus microplus]
MDAAGSSTLRGGPDTQEDSTPYASVAVFQHVDLPPFWPNNPSTWLLQVKAHFCLWQIGSPQTRYCQLVSCLSRDVAEDLGDILASPHPSHPY